MQDSHRSEDKKRRGVALASGLNGLHIKQSGPPVKFRRNQYNQLNVTTNPIPANNNGMFSSSEQPQNLSSSMNASNGRSPVGASATNVFTSNGQGVLNNNGKGPGPTNRLSTISPRLPGQGAASGAYDISPSHTLNVAPLQNHRNSQARDILNKSTNVTSGANQMLFNAQDARAVNNATTIRGDDDSVKARVLQLASISGGIGAPP